MTNSRRLERRYRRLLGFYPKAFRSEHEQEILAVLMAGATDGQQRPRLAESANLLRHAIFMRARQIQFPSPWERRHARFMLLLRVVSGTWLVVLTAILYGYGRGGWWGVLLIPAAAGHFYGAYRIRHPVQS
jgi:hypothetical protein